MSYRNKTYVSFDADEDMRYYRLLCAWNANSAFDFTFFDAHEINTILDASEESIKAGLQERFRNTKVFVILIGEHTRYLYRYVRWEIEQAVKRRIPIVAVNLNGKRSIDYERCPATLRDELAIHVPFAEKILRYALESWPESDGLHRRASESGPYHYKESVYKSLGM